MRIFSEVCSFMICMYSSFCKIAIYLRSIELQKVHKVITICGTFITIFLTIFIFCLSQEYNRNSEQLKLLKASIESTHLPFLDVIITLDNTRPQRPFLMEIENKGGPLKELKITKKDIVADVLDFSSMKKNLPRGGQHKAQFPRRKGLNTTGVYEFEYKNLFDSVFIQRLKINQNGDENLHMEFSFPEKRIKNDE